MVFQEVAGWWATYATHRSLAGDFMIITCKYTQAGMWPNQSGANSAKMPRLRLKSTQPRSHQHHNRFVTSNRLSSWDDDSSLHFFKIEERACLRWALDRLLCLLPHVRMTCLPFLPNAQHTVVCSGQCPYVLVIKYTEYYVCPALIPTRVYILLSF